jgi:hypothetical protein
MNKTFMRFNESAHKSGLLQLNPTLRSELKHATDTFSALSKTAAEYEALEDEHGDGLDAGQDLTLTQKTGLPNEESVNVGWGYTATSGTTENRDGISQISAQAENDFTSIHDAWRHAENNSLVPRRPFAIGDLFDQSRASYAPTHQPTSQPQEQLPFGLIDLLSQQQAPYAPSNPNIYSVDIPTPNVTPPSTRISTPSLKIHNPFSSKQLSPLFTYSHDETSFARRLTRAALEKGFQLLSAANMRPSALNYVFRLSLHYLNVDQLRARFKILLARSVNEELDNWEMPFIHLGGAGNHYPRRDASGNIVRRKNAWTVREVGPKRTVRIENVADGRWEDLDGLELIGMEGEWFDAYDVQGYLEEHWNCRLDPASSFAECQIEDEEPETPATWRDARGTQPFTFANLFPQDDEHVRRASDELSESPSLTHSTSNSSTSSSTSITPPTHPYNLPDVPFGLDMSFNNTDFSKFNNIDLSFDQTLGLDLAPGFDYGFAPDHNYGLDMMGLEALPVVKQKKKKTAWLEVDKLVQGKCLTSTL